MLKLLNNLFLLKIKKIKINGIGINKINIKKRKKLFFKNSFNSIIFSNTFIFFLISFLLIITAISSMSNSYTIGPNYRNISVDTRVNITNAAPEILSIICEKPITLNATSTKKVNCNVSIRDYNGFSDIDNLNATFYSLSVTVNSPLNNNTLYQNNSCNPISQNGYYANYTCSFQVYYYAVNGTWNLSAKVNDSKSFTAQKENSTLINPLYALNVTSLIDYGNLSIYDTSDNKTANITNVGNVPINVSVYGFGAVPNDGLAMVCEVGNISIENEKFSIDPSYNYSQKTPLSSSPQDIGLTIPKQTDPNTLITNTTYWQLYVPPNPFGLCNGTVVFQAEAT